MKSVVSEFLRLRRTQPGIDRHANVLRSLPGQPPRWDNAVHHANALSESFTNTLIQRRYFSSLGVRSTCREMR